VNNAITSIPRGEVLEVIQNLAVTHHETGWVWRRLAGSEERWVAHYNQNTAEELLRPLARPPDTTTAPVTSHHNPSRRLRVADGGFLLDGRSFRFIGANLRELAFYGQPLDKVKHTRIHHIQQQFDGLKAIGMRIVRLHACHKDVPVGQAISLIKATLNTLHDNNALAILVLNDSVGHSDFYIPGDQHFHEHNHPVGHLDKYAYFHDEGYHLHYLPYVSQLVPALKRHPAIFAWELGNEYAIHPQPATHEDGEAFYRFVKTASEYIHQLDPCHLITTGLMNTNQVKPENACQREYAHQLYSLTSIDFATVHFYQDAQSLPNGLWQEEEAALVDIQAVQELGKPLIVEEVGASGNDPASALDRKIKRWIDLGANGFLQWGYSAPLQDIGVGDHYFGMDRYASTHGHCYDDLAQMYQKWARTL
jgi:hypothetical protein